MPVLICDLRPDARVLTSEYERLQAAGESLALFWPEAYAEPLASGFVHAAGAAAVRAAWEEGRIAVICATAGLPLDEFERCLVVADAIADPAAHGQACARALLAAGADEVELLTPAAARHLSQSWRSGRRTGSVVLRA